MANKENKNKEPKANKNENKNKKSFIKDLKAELKKVVYKVQTLSYISKLIKNLYSFYFIIFIPVGLILFIEIRRTYKDIISNKKEKQEEKKENDGKQE